MGTLRMGRVGGVAAATPDATGRIYTVSGLKPGSTAALFANGSQTATTTVDGAGRATWTLTAKPADDAIMTYDGTVTGSAGTVAPAPVGPPTVPDGLGTITVDQGSIRFPSVNERVTNTPDASHINYLRAPSHSTATGTYFNGDQCFIFSLEVPWDELDGATATNIFGVLGNLSSAVLSPTSARTFGFMLGSRRHSSIAGKIRAVFNSESANSADWVAADLDISGYRRLLIAFRRVGADFLFEAYHRGVRVAQWTRAVGNFAATASRISADYIIGCIGTSVVGSVPVVSGSMSGLVGSVGHVGLYVGTVAQSDLEAISTGVHPLTQLSAGNWRQYRDLRDTSSASLAKPAAATGDATAPFTAVGSNLERGSDLLPVRSGSNWFAPNFIRNGFVWGRVAGQTSRSVTLAGGGSAALSGQVVQVRAFDEATGQLTRDWTDLAAIGADGSWSGAVILPRNAGWGHLDYRLKSDPVAVHRLRSKVGVGLKFGIWGQSQMEIAVKATGTNKSPQQSACLSQAYHDVTSGIVTLKRSRPDRPVSDLAAVMGDLCRTYTAEPICVVGYVKGGTSIGDLLDDSIQGTIPRQWSDVTLINGVSGADLSASIINWATEDFGGNNILEGYLDPLLRGDAPSGPLGTPYTVQHWLGDGTFQAGMRLALSPLTRHTDTTVTAAREFSGGSYTTSAARARADYYAYSTTYPGIVAAVGPSLDDMAITSSGGPHEPVDADEGPSRVARRLTVGLMRAMGLDTTVDPAITGASLVSGGTAIDVTIARPQGGSIQTAWALKGVAVPSGATTVQGFEVSIDGGATWSRSGFSAEITDAAAGKVRLSKTSGTWSSGARLRYLANGPLDYGLPTEALRLYHGMLYESGSLEGGLGLPVRGLYTATL